MPGSIIRPELKKLTTQSRAYLISNCNSQPLDVVLHYLQTGEISLNDMPALSATRRTELDRLYQEWLDTPEPPSPEEIAAWSEIEKLIRNKPDSTDILEGVLENFLAIFPNSGHRSVAEQNLREIATDRWLAVQNAPEAGIDQMRRKLNGMKDILGKYRARFNADTVRRAEGEIRALEMRILQQESRPMLDEWQGIFNMPELDLPDMRRKEKAMEDYLNKYSSRLPVDLYASMKDVLRELRDRMAIKEPEGFRYDFDRLVRFIRQQTPGSAAFRAADDLLWRLMTEELDETQLKRFIRLVPKSSYHEEAKKLLDDLEEWLVVKEAGDIFDVKNYIETHPDVHNAILEDAENVVNQLKRAELAEMEKNPSAYKKERLFGLVNIGIITLPELVNRGLTTEEAYKIARRSKQFIKDNPINVTYVDNPKVHVEDITDVYLFGVPSTGKTCVLMGLLGSSLYDWDNAIAAGEYGDILTRYRENHILPERTKNEQFFCIHGKVKDKNNKEHLVNVIELAGEQFLDKIALNPNHEVSLEDMDAIAVESFKNKNRKIFFIVIDPTVKEISYTKRIPKFDSEGHPVFDENGKQVVDEKQQGVSQKTVIQKIMNILRNEVNAGLMKKVDALHFIATKADVIDHQNKNIRDCILPDYSLSVNIAHDLSQPKNASINVATGYKPKLYSFSLGKFHVGGTFDYDSTDSDKLMNVIVENTLAIRDPSFIEKMCDTILNFKIF